MGRPQEFPEHGTVVVEEESHPIGQEARCAEQGHAHTPHGCQQGQEHQPAVAPMLADGPGHPGPILEPLVAGIVERVAEPVPDHDGVRDAQVVACLFQTDPELHVLPGAEFIVEADREEHVAAHQCRADAEPAAHPAVVMVPRQRRAPVPGAVGLAGQSELQAVVAAGLEFGQQAAQAVRRKDDVGVDQGDDLTRGTPGAQHAGGRQAAAFVGDDGCPAFAGDCGRVISRAAVDHDHFVRMLAADGFQALSQPGRGIARRNNNRHQQIVHVDSPHSSSFERTRFAM